MATIMFAILFKHGSSISASNITVVQIVLCLYLQI